MIESKNISSFNGRCNNLQLMRFIAAVLVVFNHSFILSTGSSENEWFVIITDGQYTFGGLAVSFFFFCSGFYAMKTLSTKSFSLLRFIGQRYIRLVKPLIPVVLLCVAAGGLISNLTVSEYYGNLKTWKYLLNGFLILQHDLPGVFENNIYVSTVNGSLWTLPVEFVCFVLCVIVYRLSLLNDKVTKFIFFPVLIFAYFFKYILLDTLVGAAILPASLFFVGTTYYIYRDSIILSRKMFIVCLIGLVLLGRVELLEVGMILLFPYICAYMCFHRKQVCKKLGAIGDCSYEMYLWGFPVQQLIIDRCGGGMNPYMNFVLSLPIIIVLGMGLHKMEKLLSNKVG